MKRDVDRISFGHCGDAFARLREISEDGGDLREWAVQLADLLGETANLDAFWPDPGDPS